MATHVTPIGEQIRAWRSRRRLSQLDLALEADMSARHLSFIETGRARPSRTMLLRLADRLKVPAREQNMLLVAAGFAPACPERPLDDPALAAARAAVEKVLAAYEPAPAIAVDRHWTLVSANRAAAAPLLGLAAPELREGAVNVLRLSLHPEGLAPLIENLPDWRAYVLRRLEDQIDVSGDAALVALLDELWSYPGGKGGSTSAADIAIPLRLRTPAGTLSFLTMTSMFGTPIDITLSELAIEAFLPADDETAAILGWR